MALLVHVRAQKTFVYNAPLTINSTDMEEVIKQVRKFLLDHDNYDHAYIRNGDEETYINIYETKVSEPKYTKWSDKIANMDEDGVQPIDRYFIRTYDDELYEILANYECVRLSEHDAIKSYLTIIEGSKYAGKFSIYDITKCLGTCREITITGIKEFEFDHMWSNRFTEFVKLVGRSIMRSIERDESIRMSQKRIVVNYVSRNEVLVNAQSICEDEREALDNFYLSCGGTLSSETVTMFSSWLLNKYKGDGYDTVVFMDREHTIGYSVELTGRGGVVTNIL